MVSNNTNTSRKHPNQIFLLWTHVLLLVVDHTNTKFSLLFGLHGTFFFVSAADSFLLQSVLFAHSFVGGRRWWFWRRWEVSIGLGCDNVWLWKVPVLIISLQWTNVTCQARMVSMELVFSWFEPSHNCVWIDKMWFGTFTHLCQTLQTLKISRTLSHHNEKNSASCSSSGWHKSWHVFLMVGTVMWNPRSTREVNEWLSLARLCCVWRHNFHLRSFWKLKPELWTNLKCTIALVSNFKISHKQKSISTNEPHTRHPTTKNPTKQNSKYNGIWIQLSSHLKFKQNHATPFVDSVSKKLKVDFGAHSRKCNKDNWMPLTWKTVLRVVVARFAKEFPLLSLVDFCAHKTEQGWQGFCSWWSFKPQGGNERMRGFSISPIDTGDLDEQRADNIQPWPPNEKSAKRCSLKEENPFPSKYSRERLASCSLLTVSSSHVIARFFWQQPHWHFHFFLLFLIADKEGFVWYFWLWASKQTLNFFDRHFRLVWSEFFCHHKQTWCRILFSICNFDFGPNFCQISNTKQNTNSHFNFFCWLCFVFFSQAIKFQVLTLCCRCQKSQIWKNLIFTVCCCKQQNKLNLSFIFSKTKTKQQQQQKTTKQHKTTTSNNQQQFAQSQTNSTKQNKKDFHKTQKATTTTITSKKTDLKIAQQQTKQQKQNETKNQEKTAMKIKTMCHWISTMWFESHCSKHTHFSFDTFSDSQFCFVLVFFSLCFLSDNNISDVTPLGSVLPLMKQLEELDLASEKNKTNSKKFTKQIRKNQSQKQNTTTTESQQKQTQWQAQKR